MSSKQYCFIFLARGTCDLSICEMEYEPVMDVVLF